MPRFLGELPEDVYPRPEDRNPWRPPRGDGIPGAGVVPVVHRGDLSIVPFIATTTSKEVLSANPKRAYFLIQNKGAATIYVNFGGPASQDYLELKAGVSYEPEVAPTNSVSVIAAAGSISGVIVQGFAKD